MARRKKTEDAPAGSPAWMATFSDLMNLLLCFFVLLFSMSTVDAQKFYEVVASLQSSFSVLPSGGSTIGEGQMVGNGVSQLKELDVYFNEAMTSTNSNGKEDSKGDGNSDYVKEYTEASTAESEKMAEQIQNALNAGGIAEKVNVEFNEQYVLLTLNGTLLFESGKADLQEEAKPLIQKIGQIIQRYNTNIIEVEGHTDNVPITGGKYENNDVLSTFRALSVSDYLKSVSNIDAALLKFSGRGEHVPIADNTTAEGRAKNRRVEIKIYNSYYSKK